MDCLRAMELLSEAHDSGETAVAGIEEAREHCESCADCAAFASGLAILDRIPVPVARVDVLDRILGRVDAERVRLGSRTALPHAKAREAPAVRVRQKGWWIPRLTAAAAAVAVIAGVALVTRAGIITITSPPGGDGFSAEKAAVQDTGAESLASPLPEGRMLDSEAGGLGTSLSATESAIAPSFAGGPAYVVVDGIVHALGGAQQVDAGDLSESGRTETALGGQGATRARPVYARKDVPDRIYLYDDTGGLLEFRLVTRSIKGVRHVLRSDPVFRFGLWPQLPSGYPAPAAADGSPTFAADGQDELGVTVYSPIGGPPGTGYAIAPGTSAADPAAGNPNWTFWAPVRTE